MTPFLKEAMTTASLTPGIVFFFFMNIRINSLRDSPFFWWIWNRSHSTPGLAKVPWKLSMNLVQRSLQELIEFAGIPVSQSYTVGDRMTGRYSHRVLVTTRSTEALAFVVAPMVLLFFPLTVPPVD